MKRIIGALLIGALLLSLCACGGIDEETQAKLELYNKYENYIELLEAGEYQKLMDKLEKKYGDKLSSDTSTESSKPTEDDTPAETIPAPTVAPAPTAGEEPDGPTESEQAVLDTYGQIYTALHRKYVSQWHDEEANIYYSGESARTFWYAKYYSELQALDLAVIDKWLGTEYLDSEVNWDYASLLNGFTVLEDVPLFQISTVTDRMGNEETGIYAWIYADTGVIWCEDYFTNSRKFEMILTDPMDLFNTFSEYAEYTYDSNGRPAQVQHLDSSGNVVYLVDVFYDDAGNKVKETVQCNSGEADILYTYDDQNRLIQLSYQDSINIYNNYHEYVITYTYDEQGNLLRSDKTNTYYGRIQGYESIVYTYDDSGKLVSGICTNENLWNDVPNTITQDSYTFVCDEQGRILSMDVAYGDTYYISGSPNGEGGQVASNATRVSCSREFVYGDYVCFTPSD